MPTGDVLTPKEAAHIATNAYFTLKDWINEEPKAGVETRANIQNRVTGPATAGSAAHADTSLRNTGLAGASLGNVHSAETGFGTGSGFGYTLTYEGGGRKHVVIATRGTRPEMPGMPDIITDLRGAMTPFGDFGPVHKGFKKTYDSIMPNLARDRSLIAGADVVHCVGHSLGGGVATLIAGHYATLGRNVKLYTFGSPRVGCFNTYMAFERCIGEQSIYRVAHDLDPITLIAPFPYIHVQPRPGLPGNLTLLSPTGKLLSTANHDMAQYIQSVGDLPWSAVRRLAGQVDHDNALLARWLLHGDDNPSWVKYASVQTLSLLFKLFNYVLRAISTALLLSLSAVDLLAEVLLKGLNKTRQLGSQILTLLRYAAKWAGIKLVDAADASAAIIKAILSKMLGALRDLGATSIAFVTRNIAPLSIGIAGAMTLTASSVL